ncbi:Rieske (2Fe-2S) protein [Tenacibaculum amylolyticum]|uniref:Rieske (2Fe-2S) protein n=1 Tax=Tenacibaculum amylolyticum TaxID=104269 RepID=UPI003893A194
MKKFFLILVGVVFMGCSNNPVVSNCFLGISMNETINLSNPQFIDIQVPGGHTIARIGGRDVIIIRRTSSSFKVYDLQCPEKDCSNRMTFDGLKLICPCSQKEYNSLNGSPIDGNGCFALEYTVTQISSSALQITL